MMGYRRAASPLRLLIVDDQSLVAHALESLLRRHTPLSVSGVATDWQRAAEVANRIQPQVVLVDPLLRETNRLQSLRSFTAAHPNARLLFLDEFFRPVILRIAVALQACGYWSKQSAVERIAEALPMAAAGTWTACPEAGAYVAWVDGRMEFRRPPQTPLLTLREVDVLGLLVQGLSVKECAECLSLAPSTVENHKARFMKKLGLHRMCEVVRWAIREGLG